MRLRGLRNGRPALAPEPGGAAVSQKRARHDLRISARARLRRGWDSHGVRKVLSTASLHGSLSCALLATVMDYGLRRECAFEEGRSRAWPTPGMCTRVLNDSAPPRSQPRSSSFNCKMECCTRCRARCDYCNRSLLRGSAETRIVYLEGRWFVLCCLECWRNFLLHMAS